MIAPLVPYLLVVLLCGTYLMQLWTGIAIAGWSGSHAVIHRSQAPSQYWFVMSLQTGVLVVGGWLFLR